MTYKLLLYPFLIGFFEKPLESLPDFTLQPAAEGTILQRLMLFRTQAYRMQAIINRTSCFIRA